jgi:hypothetical protein
MVQQENFDEKESLKLITEMINKTKESFHDTGFGPIMWGALIALCSIAQYCSIVFHFNLPFNVWLLPIIAIVPQIYYSIQQGKKIGAKSYNDIAMDFTWIAFGISMGILSYVVNVIGVDLKNGIPNYMQVRGNFRFYDHTTSLFLILYAIPTFITGGIMKFKPMLFGGILCWVLAFISVFTKGDIDMLLTAVAAIFAWLIPGIMINKGYRKYKAANV